MTKAARTLAFLVLNIAVGLLATPAAAQQAGSPPSNAVCSEDVICVDSATVATWPLDRWTTVRRADRRIATPQTAHPIGTKQ